MSAYHSRGSVQVCSIAKPASSNKAPSVFSSELVAVLGMDGFEGRELNAQLRCWDIYALIARALQVHLHARLHAIPARPMPEAVGIEVRAEFSD